MLQHPQSSPIRTHLPPLPGLKVTLGHLPLVITRILPSQLTDTHGHTIPASPIPTRQAVVKCRMHPQRSSPLTGIMRRTHQDMNRHIRNQPFRVISKNIRMLLEIHCQKEHNHRRFTKNNTHQSNKRQQHSIGSRQITVFMGILSRKRPCRSRLLSLSTNNSSHPYGSRFRRSR